MRHTSFGFGKILGNYDDMEKLVFATVLTAAGKDPSCTARVLCSVGYCCGGFGKIFSNYDDKRQLSIRICFRPEIYKRQRQKTYVPDLAPILLLVYNWALPVECR